MKLFLSFALVTSASAFAPSIVGTTSHATTTTSLTATRSEFLAAVATATLALPSAAHAAKYGSFGAGSSGVINPSTATIDAERLSSPEVQAALKQVRAYQAVVANMSTSLQSTPQFDLRPILIKELDVAGLRTALNVVNSVVNDDEDSQRGTDRLIRVIIQDIAELEAANAVRDGAVRSPRRLEILQGKLTKLTTALNDFVAFAQ